MVSRAFHRHKIQCTRWTVFYNCPDPADIGTLLIYYELVTL